MHALECKESQNEEKEQKKKKNIQKREKSGV